MPRLRRTEIPSTGIPSRRPRRPGFLRRIPAVFAVLAVLAVFAVPPGGLRAQDARSDTPSASESLRILLTNDDGYRAPGITAMREALVSAGHDVVLVAPSDNQSSSSGRLSRGILQYEEAESGVWHVDGSPGTSVLLGLARIVNDSPPDLVISGANFGQNIGTSTSSSGTVGAAVHATRQGYPAISVSAAITPEGARAQPPYPGTREAFPAAADLVVRLVDDLIRNRPDGGRLLPEGLLLNVNHPALPASRVRGIRVEPVSDVDAYRRGFEPTGTPGEVETTLTPVGAEDLPAGSDVRLLAEGWVVINVIDTRGHPAPEAVDELVARLESIR